ncbi:hypothetical protein J5N97_007391 [Dioscorea zingiberensis]|uniref:LOB domain-containing protein n=1 Tax=Dioscorea zingiberensis TaxID=325984 RepID=A0A9D5DDX6_9LILI|nr:hypothetical protein J5N97_007391 [Dioscorea zingiberensis]
MVGKKQTSMAPETDQQLQLRQVSLSVKLPLLSSPTLLRSQFEIVALMASSSSSSNSPCAACKFLRRKCMPGCIFAPYFPPEEPQKFANVHKIFGASNVTKLLNEVLPHQREDAVNSLAYEAEARMKDPVYGCVGAISVLQRQVQRLQKELDAANADLLRYACGEIPTAMPVTAMAAVVPAQTPMARTRNNNGGGGALYFASGAPLSYSPSLWSTGNNVNNTAAGDMDQRKGGETSM